MHYTLNRMYYLTHMKWWSRWQNAFDERNECEYTTLL